MPYIAARSMLKSADAILNKFAYAKVKWSEVNCEILNKIEFEYFKTLIEKTAILEHVENNNGKEIFCKYSNK